MFAAVAVTYDIRPVEGQEGERKQQFNEIGEVCGRRDTYPAAAAGKDEICLLGGCLSSQEKRGRKTEITGISCLDEGYAMLQAQQQQQKQRRCVVMFWVERVDGDRVFVHVGVFGRWLVYQIEDILSLTFPQQKQAIIIAAAA